MARIPPEEIEPHPHSFADRAGRLFYWRGELYRAFRRDVEGTFAALLDDGVLDELARRRLLIETEPTELELDGYGLVVRHRRIPFPSYPNEWCAPMFKSAVLALLDLATELAQDGLTLKDAHPWNVVFDGATPVWVDVGSIQPDGDPVWAAAREFVRFCLNPLLLMAAGRVRLARHLLPEYEGVDAADAAAAPFRTRRIGRRMAALAGQARRPGPASRALFFRRLREAIASIEVVYDTHGDLRDDGDGAPELDPLLTSLAPASALTVDSPSAARRIAERGALVVALDRREATTARLFEVARDEGARILPLVMDVTLPTPSRGIREHWQIAATSRLRSEVVVALGVVGPVHAAYGLPVPRILEALASFATRALVVDAPATLDSEPDAWPGRVERVGSLSVVTLETDGRSRIGARHA